VLKAPSLTTPANRPGAKDPRIQGSQDAAIVRTRKSTAVAKKRRDNNGGNKEKPRQTVNRHGGGKNKSKECQLHRQNKLVINKDNTQSIQIIMAINQMMYPANPY